MTTSTIKYHAPLKINVENYQGPITIDKFLIRRMEKSEMKRYFGSENIELDDYGRLKSSFNPDGIFGISFFSHLENFRYLTCHYIIECEDEKYMKEKLSKLLLAFRLYKQGEIISPLILNTDNASIHVIYPLFIKDTVIYKINSSEIDKINSYFNLICNASTKLDIILERYTHVITKDSNVNSCFLDLIGILENILLQGDKNELRFKFSLYLSYLLRNKFNIDIAFNKVLDIYDIRSELAHSGNSSKFSKELFNEVKEYTRLVICWFMVEGIKVNLKENILNNLGIKVK